MRMDSFAVAVLLLGTGVLAVGTLVTLATTTLVDTGSIGTVVVVVLVVLGAVGLGTWADEKPRTPYW